MDIAAAPFADIRSPESTRLLARLGLSALLAGHIDALAHDLRSPVQTLVMASGALGSRADLGGAGLQLQGLIEGATRRLDGLLEGLSLPDVERAEIEPVAISDTVRQAMRLWPVARAARGSTVHVDLPPDLPAALAADGPLCVALAHLVLNGIEAVAGDPEGRVEIRATASDGAVLVLVEDNGPGIPTALRSRVLDPFFTGRDGRHCGLGLMVASRLAAAMGGALWVAETGDGPGTRVALRLDAWQG